MGDGDISTAVIDSYGRHNTSKGEVHILPGSIWETLNWRWLLNIQESCLKAIDMVSHPRGGATSALKDTNLLFRPHWAEIEVVPVNKGS